MKKLENKVVVITGGSSGMGAAMAKAFVEKGAKVALFDLDNVKAEDVLNSVSEKANLIFCKVDVTDKQQIQTASESVEKTFGPITSWVNSAGFSKMSPFLESDEKMWDATMNVNLKAVYLCSQVAIERMLKNGGGEIINMSSLSGKKASSWQTIYCASKFGVQGLSQAIAKEFADQNIRVNTICPGIVETEMWDKLKYEYALKRNMNPDDVMDYFKRNIPMHRLVEIKDVVNAAEFLLTDNSSYLTGQSINLVGGEWMD
ncbi:SDR family NAD(P)-dependent oxidoreductase [Enterococcus gilvus]|nr:SDR family oxidoreductase [Enterococcus gilvus]OJG42835.1 hypothetical protein RV02_GL003303 [Enterococcus gilvus]